MSLHRRLRHSILILFLAGAALPVVVQLALGLWARPLIHGAESVPPRRVALVYGAGIYRDGRLGKMLQDRVETSVALYREGKVQRLLMSGDNRFVEHDEPGRMKDYAVALDVPPVAIQPDYGGRRTYDSCYRARYIFGLDRVTLVTQAFHLPRALLICRALGLDAVGVPADRHPYPLEAKAWSVAREALASMKALIDVSLRKPAPIMGQPVTIR